MATKKMRIWVVVMTTWCGLVSSPPSGGAETSMERDNQIIGFERQQ